MSRPSDVVAAKEVQRRNRLLHAHVARFGRFAFLWDEEIDAGLAPWFFLEFVGNPYDLDREKVTVDALKRIRNQ